MMRWIYLFACTVIFQISFGQSSLDSLLSIDQSTKPLRKNVFTNMNISREYFILGDYDTGVQYGKKALQIAKGLDNDTLVGQASFFTALNAFEINADSGFHYYKQSVELLLPLKHDWATFAINNLCTEYTEMSWYSEALDNRLKSLDYFREQGDTTMLIHTMIRIGYIHDRIGEFEESLKWYNKAEPIALVWGDTLSIADVYAYRGIAYDELLLFDSAHYYNKKAIDLFKSIGEMYAYSVWCSNIGNTYLKQENYDRAEEYLLESLNSFQDDVGDDKSVKMINLSKVYYHNNDYEKADSLLLEGLEVALDFTQYKFISEAYFTYSESMEKRGLYDEALANYKLFKIYEDSSFNEEKANQIAYHNAKFNIQEKEKELLLHKNKSQELANDKLQLDLQLTSRNFWIVLLSMVLLIGGLLGFFIFQRNRRRLEREKNEALVKEKDLGIKAVIAAQEAERTRIARELHDGIVQDLTLAKKQLNNIAHSNSEEAMIKEIAEDLDRSAQEVRNISHELMPFALKELGLVAAMEDMLEKVLSAHGVQYDFSYIGLDDRLPSKFEIAIYRIAQELINNVIKHSKASELEIMLSYRNDLITFRIEDNGIGMVTNSDAGIGLQSIKSRLDLLNGVFKFEEERQQGLVAIIQIPFDQKH